MTKSKSKRVRKPKRRNPVNFVQVACWLTHEQRDGLRAVQRRTRLTQQNLLRDGVELMLAHYREVPR
jgi:hypothetical protein